VENGDHITFTCPNHRTTRKTLIGLSSTWAELDAPRWVKEGDDDPYDQVEAFFGYLFIQLSGR